MCSGQSKRCPSTAGCSEGEAPQPDITPDADEPGKYFTYILILKK